MTREGAPEPKFELGPSVNEKLKIEEDEQVIFNKQREYFEEFLRKTDQKENLNKFLIENCPPEKTKKILSIGAGSGEDVMGFLKHLKSQGADFEFYYLDPSKLSFQEFKKKAEEFKLTEHISGVELNKFESFETEEKFDTIIASHVFYYIEDWERCLKKIVEMLNPDGKAFIMMQSKDSDNFNFRNKFLKNEHYAEELINLIRGLNLNYDSEKIISMLDVTDIISENNKPSLSGKQLLSFLLRTNYDDLEEDIKSKAIAYILENSKIKNKRRIFQLVDSFITIKKEQQNEKF